MYLTITSRKILFGKAASQFFKSEAKCVTFKKTLLSIAMVLPMFTASYNFRLVIWSRSRIEAIEFCLLHFQR